jgi:glycosyltransferase involved in cell wall biosynthesis
VDGSKLPKVSVIVCTRNRAESLTRCLAYYVEIQTSYNWELIVVDNGSSDATLVMLGSEVKFDRLPLIILNERRVGLSRARNVGIKHARGEIIVFSDDDCYPDRGFIDEWVNVFKDPKIGFSGGRIELFDPHDAAVTIKTETSPEFFEEKSLISPGTMHGASMAFRRCTIDAVGLFDELLGAGSAIGSGEDSDYFQRASELGFIGRYSPEPLVWHHHGRKASDIAKLYPAYDRGRGAFYGAILSRNPQILLSAISRDFGSQTSFRSYVGQLYWRNKDRLLQRIWNVSISAIKYWIVREFARYL